VKRVVPSGRPMGSSAPSRPPFTSSILVPALTIPGMSSGTTCVALGTCATRTIAAFERIFGATMFFGTEKLMSTAKVVQRSRFNFLREAHIWYNRCSENMLPDEPGNVIVLSDEFYQEITSHRRWPNVVRRGIRE
jgi:hypothetical protein